MKRKKLVAFMLTIAAAVSLTACGSGENGSASGSSASAGSSGSETAGTETKGDGKSVYSSSLMTVTESSPLFVKNTSGKKYKFGIIVEEMSPFMSQCVDGASKFAKDHSDVTVSVAVGNNDVAKELSSVENFIANGYDAVIMKPLDSEGCAPAVDYCKKANIPLVAMNNNFSGKEADTYVGSDHELSGELCAEGIGQALKGKGNVVVLSGPLDQDAAIQRNKGVEKVLKEKYPNIKIIDTQDAGWSTDEALNKTENWISSGKKFDGIVATCSQMAVGAQLALKGAGKKPGEIPIASIDAMEMSLKIYKEGWVTSDVLQDAYGQGYTSAAAAYALVNGKKVDSYIDVPYVKVEPNEVDKFLARYK